MRTSLTAPDDIKDEVALVTGGSRGLGLAIARELARHGCRLVICARDQAELDRAKDDLRSRGAEVTAVACDITDDTAPETLIGTAVNHHGRLDIVVNNAGIIQVAPLANTTTEDYEQAIQLMALAPARITLAALPLMRDQGHGRIVNITSIGGKLSVPHLLPYCVAKFAAVAFSEGLRAELAGGPVTVTTAVPGLMRTGSHLQALFGGQREAEFTWFSLAASLPPLSMDADRAAQRIVSAMRERKPEVILTPVAQVVARGAALVPGLTARVMHATAALLPGPETGPEAGPRHRSSKARGERLTPAMSQKLFDRLTTLGRAAARRLNETDTGT